MLVHVPMILYQRSQMNHVMQAVVLAAGKGSRLRPLTDDKPKAMVEIDDKPILTHCFEQLVELGADELFVVVGYLKEEIISHYGDEFEGVPITYSHQREANGLAHALLTVEDHIDQDFMLMLGDNIFEANLEDVVRRQREDRADAAFLVEEVPYEEASRYGVCDTNDYGEITAVVEKPDEPPTNLVMTGFYTFTPAIFHACHLTQPSGRDEYELSDAVNLLLQSGRTIDAIRMDGWRVDVGYPEDRDRAEERLRNSRDEAEAASPTTGSPEPSDDAEAVTAEATGSTDDAAEDRAEVVDAEES
jgi:glucose-1-phosphate thymidylyltransferase